MSEAKKLSDEGQVALRLLRAAKGRDDDIVNTSSGGQTVDFRAAPGLREIGGYITDLDGDIKRLRMALRDLQRYGPPGRPELACWCNGREPHSPGCKTARAALNPKEQP